MLNSWYLQVVDIIRVLAASTFVNTLIGAFLGVFFAGVYQNHKDRKTTIENKVLCLTNLKKEFEYNKKHLNRIKTYLMDGPEIDHLWSPAVVISNYFQFSAWDQVVIKGVLNETDFGSSLQLQITSRSIIDVKRILNETESNWHRVNEWHDHDVSNKNQLLTSRKLFKSQALTECLKSASYALEQIEEGNKNIDLKILYLRNSRRFMGLFKMPGKPSDSD